MIDKKYIVEFIGTFFLVLTIALTGNPIAIGAILVAMVYFGGYISGAHYNPAVSTTLFLQKKLNFQTYIKYVVTQFIAAMLAAFVFLIIKGNYFLVVPGLGVNFWTAVLCEMIFTFALCTVVLNTAVSEKTKGNNYYGIAIGLTVAAGAFAVGAISGGAFNPAVGIGPYLLNIQNIGSNLNFISLYILGPISGALLASLVYSQTSSKNN